MRLEPAAPRRSQKATVGLGLSAVALVGWWQLVASPMANGGPKMGGAGTMEARAFLGMWLAMVAAVMLPTVIPMATAAWAVVGRAQPASRVARWVSFVGAYVALWAATGIAALGTWDVARDRSIVAAALIATAGLYQLGRFKQSCLRSCRAPLAFFLGNGQHMSSVRGAAWLGLRHGCVCVGCCAGLMVALTGAGVVDAAWTGSLALVMLLEKVHPRGMLLGRAAGYALLLAAPFASTLSGSGGSVRLAGVAAMVLVALTAVALAGHASPRMPAEAV